MDYELEQFMLRKIIIDRHAGETFKWAEEDYRKKCNYDKMRWWKKIIFNMQLSQCGSERFTEMKQIQSGYIDKIMITRTTLSHGSSNLNNTPKVDLLAEKGGAQHGSAPHKEAQE